MNARNTTRIVAIVLGAALGLVGCAQGNPTGPATPNTESPSPSPTMTGPVANPNAHYPFHREPGPLWNTPERDPSTNEDGTAGSGCDVAESAPLPDGVWRGLLWANQEGGIDFDLVCSYARDSQRWADSVVDPEIDASVPDDEIIDNLDGTIRTLPLASDAIAWDGYADSDDPFAAEAVLDRYRQIDYYVQNGLPVWIWVNDGQVTEFIVIYYQ